MAALRFGSITAQKIVELERFEVDAPWLIANCEPDIVMAERERLGADFIAPDGKLRIGVHSWLLRAEGLTIIVDTCCGDHRDRGASPFSQLQTDYLANLARAGVKREEVDVVFCTHLHVDHVGWNVMLQDGRFVPTFPNARYLFSEADFNERLALEKSAGGRAAASNAAFRECVVPIVDAGLATFVEPGHDVLAELSDALRVVSLPGHCVGHSGLEIDTGDGHGLLTGDAIHHPLQLERPHWYCAADVDPETSSATRRELIERYGDTATTLLTAHFGGTSAGRITGKGGRVGFDFVA